MPAPLPLPLPPVGKIGTSLSPLPPRFERGAKAIESGRSLEQQVINLQGGRGWGSTESCDERRETQRS